MIAFGGRSTTAALDVQQVMGDPMSDDPADIYITRDKFDEGDLHGRLVCAIYVNQQGFVEITVHPADGGRFRPVPETPSVTPSPLPTNHVEIVTHCGLEFARVEYDGQLWRFRVEQQANSPPGWGFNTTVVEVRPGPDGPIVIGPDGSVWPLVPVEADASPVLCL